MLSQGEECRVDLVGGGGGGWQQTRQKYDKSPTPKMYTIGLVSSVTVMYFASWGDGEKRRGLMPVGLFLLAK